MRSMNAVIRELSRAIGEAEIEGGDDVYLEPDLIRDARDYLMTAQRENAMLLAAQTKAAKAGIP